MITSFRIFIFLILLLFATGRLFAQIPFEGIIKYRVQSSLILHGSIKKVDTYIVIHFGRAK